MIRPIRTDDDHRDALRRIAALMDAEPGTEDFDTLDVLATLVEKYEEENFPVDLPSPEAAILFRMEQAGLTLDDLAPHIGDRAEAAAVLAGRQELTLPMIRALHRRFGIPADAMLE